MGVLPLGSRSGARSQQAAPPSVHVGDEPVAAVHQRPK
jgi:hypothetical protein